MRLRTLLRNRIHAVVADHGHDRPAGGWSDPGRAWLASLELAAVSREVVGDDLALIDALGSVIDRLDWEICQRARSDPRVKVLLIGSDTVAAELTQELRMRDRYISGTRSPIATCGDVVIAARCRSLAGQIDANALRSHGDLIPNP